MIGVNSLCIFSRKLQCNQPVQNEVMCSYSLLAQGDSIALRSLAIVIKCCLSSVIFLSSSAIRVYRDKTLGSCNRMKVTKIDQEMHELYIYIVENKVALFSGHGVGAKRIFCGL